MTCAWIETSNAETGSSATKNRGRSASARAIRRAAADRRRPRADGDAGLRPTTRHRPEARQPLRCAPTWCRPRGCRVAPATNSPIRMCGFSAEPGSWKIIWRSRRTDRNARPRSAVISRPRSTRCRRSAQEAAPESDPMSSSLTLTRRQPRASRRRGPSGLHQPALSCSRRRDLSSR